LEGVNQKLKAGERILSFMISVIIPVYNGEYMIKRAIESVLSQTYRDFEIIVVDDGSTDNTSEVLKPYRDRIGYFYQENRGVAGARNKGIEKSKGEYIAFLDQDDIWLPEKLELQAKYLDGNTDVSMVYSRYWREYEDTGGKKLRPKKKYLEDGYIYTKVLFRYLIWIGTVMLRRSCFDVLGKFDTSLVPAEDKDMLLRVAKNYKVGFIEDPLAIHRIRKNSLARHNKLKNLIARERVLNLGFQGLKPWEKFLYFILYRFKHSRHLAKIGKHYLKEREYQTSKHLYSQAIIKYPFRLKYWVGLLKSMVKGALGSQSV